MDAKDPFAAALGGEVTSPSDSHATLGQHFSTLDYLGLADSDGVHSRADSGSSANGASRLDDIRSPGQNGLNSRNRASTVSNFARPLGPSPSADDFANDEYAGQDVNQLSRAVEQMNVYDAYDEGGYYDSTGNAHRPRATTIGPLDNPRQTRGFGGNMPAAAAYGNTNLGPYGTSYLHAQALQGGYHQTQGHGYGVYPPRTRADHLMGTPMGMQMGMGGMGMGKTHSHSRSRDGAMRHAPRMSGSGHTSRTGTPMQDLGSMGMGGASTPQMPTRSLWIGNLDVTASQETLLRVFAPYGPIESVRLLPEKVRKYRDTEKTFMRKM
jgi:protein JSN1